MIDHILLTLDDSVRWNDYLHRLPVHQQDIYFTPNYYRLYEKYGDGVAKCYVFEKDDNLALYPFLMNSINGMGFSLDKEYFDIQGAYGYNGAACSTTNEGFLKEFNEAFKSFCIENSIIAEFTRFNPITNNINNSVPYLSIIADRETVLVDTRNSYAKIWNEDYSSQNRNMVRKAKKLGYSVEILSKPDNMHLEKFMEIYTYSMTRSNAGDYYFFNKQYFGDLFNLLQNNSYLFNVFDKGNELICSSIFLHYGKYFHYHLSGRNKVADNSVNNFLIDNAVLFAQENGAEFFHLGGGRSSDKSDSLLKFKLNFSKSKAQFYIGKRIHNPEIYNNLIKQWETKFPEKKEQYRHFLLKYRY
jgi:hypothetical protein